MHLILLIIIIYLFYYYFELYNNKIINNTRRRRSGGGGWCLVVMSTAYPLLTDCLPTAYHLGMLRFFKNLTGSSEDTFVDSTTSVIDAKNRRVAYWIERKEISNEIKSTSIIVCRVLPGTVC